MSNQNTHSFPISEKISWVIFWVVAFLMVWLANPAAFYFLNDDHIHIPKAYDGTIGHHNALRHINDLSLYLDSLLWKENAFGYHLTNLLLYLANMLLVIPVFTKLSNGLGVYLPKSIAILASALFGLYAFHSEALYWILCRTASLSLFFNLLSFLCLLKTPPNRFWQLAAIITFLLGLFTYETLWLYPVWLLVWWYLMPNEKRLLPLQKQTIYAIWALFIAYFPFRRWSTGEALGAYEAQHLQKFEVKILIENSYKLFFRSFLPPTQNDLLFKIASLVVLALLAIIAFVVIKRKLWDRFLVFTAFAWLSAYTLFISLGVSVKGFESERYLYYPSVWLCLLLVMFIWRIFTSKLLILSSLTALFLFHFYYNYQASNGFKHISAYSRMSMQTFQNVPLEKKIVIHHLPVYSYGLPLYNYGFKDGIQWLCPGRDSSSVEVLSTMNFEYQSIKAEVKSSAVADTVIFSGY